MQYEKAVSQVNGPKKYGSISMDITSGHALSGKDGKSTINILQKYVLFFKALVL